MSVLKMYIVVTNLILVLYCLPLLGDLGHSSSPLDGTSARDQNPLQRTEYVHVPTVGSLPKADSLSSTEKTSVHQFEYSSRQKENYNLGHSGDTTQSKIVSDNTLMPELELFKYNEPPGDAIQRFLTNRKNGVPSQRRDDDDTSHSDGMDRSALKVMAPRVDLPVGEENVGTSNRIHVSNIPEIAYIYQNFGSCHSVFPSPAAPIYMVDRCPGYIMDMDLRQRCGFVLGAEYRYPDCVIDISQLPVQDIEGVVYRNIHCAFCHGAMNPSTWSTEIVTDVMTHFDTDENKNILILTNDADMTPNCIQTRFPVHEDKIAVCSPRTEQEPSRSHHGRSLSASNANTKTSVFPLSFQILMNFGINGKGHIFFSASTLVKHRCDENQVFDHNTHKCKNVECAPGYKVVKSNCEPSTDYSTTDTAQDKLDTFSQDEGTSQITLRLNVTLKDLVVLGQENTALEIVQELSTRLNISASRIKNFTMEILNGTVSGKELEIHHVVSEDSWRKINPLLPETDPSIPGDAFSNPSGNTIDSERLEPYGTGTGSASTTQLDPDYAMTKTYTLILKFIIFPAKKKSKKDVPTSSVIDAIKSMIEVKSFSFSLNGTNFNVDGVDNGDPLIMESWCTKGRIDYYMGDEFSFSSHHNNQTGQMTSGIYVNSTNTFYDQTLFDLYVMLTTTLGEVSDVNTSSYVFVCDMPRIVDKACGRIEIVDSEYKRYSNNSIGFSGEMLSLNEYEYVNDSLNTLRLCIPQSYVSGQDSTGIFTHPCGERFKDVIMAENYLSFILGIVSLVAMVSVLVTYGLFDTLRNLPGINTINLTVSLFLGELLFLISGLAAKQELDWLCKAIAVCLHYIFLASFFWMNVMAYDLYRTFGHTCILAMVRERKNFFWRYFVYAWGSPAVIVTVCSVIDFSGLFDDVRIGYGSLVDMGIETGLISSTPSSNESENHNNKTASVKPQDMYKNSLTEANLGCWIMEPVATLVSFGLPMILILISNAVMFIKTIVCIRAVARLAHLKTRRSSLNHVIGKYDVVLYVRMSSVMGFTWIVGLASSITSAFADGPTETICVILHTIGILFILFNCSQGVFIFGAFVFNRRVLGLYKAKLRKWRDSRSNRLSFSSTSTLSSSLP